MKQTILISLILATVVLTFANATEEFGSKTELKFLSEEIQQKTVSQQAPTDFYSYVFTLQLPRVQYLRYGGNCEDKIKIVLDVYQKLNINTIIQSAGFVLDETKSVQT